MEMSFDRDLADEIQRVLDKVLPYYVQMECDALMCLRLLKGQIEDAQVALKSGKVDAIFDALEELQQWENEEELDNEK